MPRGDYKLLGEKILELLNDDKLIYKMSNNSLKKVEEFDEIKILSEWENYLKKFL